VRSDRTVHDHNDENPATADAGIDDLLLPHHLEALRSESGISDQAILARGYRSVVTFKAARDLGFSQSQSLVPALAIPLWNVRGERVGYVLRPDAPRTLTNGKVAKYEQQRGKPPVLDVSPLVVSGIGDPDVALFISEGTKKADALASRGACAINLSGVWNWRGTNKSGGKTALADWEDVALNNRVVRIVFDSDVARKKEVASALRRLKAYLESRGAHVQVIYLPDTADGRKQGVDDFLAAGGTLADLVALARDDVARVEPKPTEIPEIYTTDRYLPELAQEAWVALVTWRQGEGHELFARESAICRVIVGGDGARIYELKRDDLAFVVERTAHFMRASGQFGTGPLVPDRVPRELLDDMLAAWKKPLPELQGVVRTPVFAPDGSFETHPGYSPSTRLFYAPIGTPVPEVPREPTPGDLRQARRWLFDEWLVDVPFADDASQAHVIAACLTALTRPMFAGPTPLFAIDAPTPGTGKGLLAQTIGLVIGGRVPAVTTVARDGEEERKRYTSLLREGADVILIDNVKSRLNSPILAAALTSDRWRDRVLGLSETVDLPNRAVWMATGNNIELDGEIGRRTALIRLDAKRDRPWERRQFKHPKLLQWVGEHRHELLWSLAVVVRHWLAVERPIEAVPSMGSFEGWSEVVGGVLQSAGIAGFLENREQLYRQADQETDEWRRFALAWWERFGAELLRVGDLLELCREHDLLGDVLDGRSTPSDQGAKTKLGKAIAYRRDRRFGDFFLRIPSEDKHQKGKLYRLEPADPGDGDVGRSAEGPQDFDPNSNLAADLADLADPISSSRAGEEGENPDVVSTTHAQEGGDQGPQSPQGPRLNLETDPIAADRRADPRPGDRKGPQCVTCGLVMSVVRISETCGACKRQLEERHDD